MKRKTFIMSDESVNRYGFRVLTSGIDTTEFEKNPVGLFMHEREYLPICRWENIRKEGGKLIGDAVFDDKDELAMKVFEKLEGGFMGACSIGFNVLALSEDVKDALPGQRYATVTKCTLLECSIVDIPANANAIQLYSSPDTKGTVENLLPKLKKKDKMELVFKTLGLEVGSEENLAVSKIKELQTEMASLKSLNQTLEDKLVALEETAKKEKATVLVDSALAANKILASEKEAYQRLAELSYDDVKKLLDAKEPYKPITTQIDEAKEKGTSQEDRTNWTLNDWRKKDSAGLGEMKLKNPDKYKELLDKK